MEFVRSLKMKIIGNKNTNHSNGQKVKTKMLNWSEVHMY